MKNFFLCTFLFLPFSFLLAQAVYDGSTKHTFTTNHGTIDIGPFNSSYGHIYTDRPKIIFNKDVYTTTNAFSSYNNDLIFKTKGAERMRINDENGNVGIGYTDPQSPLHVVGSHDAIMTLQTNDDNWLYTNWKSSNGTRKAYVGLDNSLSEFRINVENGTDEIILNGGNVGVGTFSPTSKLDVNGNIKATENITVNKNGSYRIALNGTSDGYIYGRNDNVENKFLIHSNGNSWFNGGNVGIGTTAPDSKLTVKGNIHTEEVRVDLSVPGPDYVFKQGYDLKSLEEVQDYIKEHGHLPNIPPAKEMEANGIQLGEMNMKLLEKIEELTLYTIQQQEKIKELKKANDKIQLLEKKLEKLSKIIIQNEKN